MLEGLEVVLSGGSFGLISDVINDLYVCTLGHMLVDANSRSSMWPTLTSTLRLGRLQHWKSVRGLKAKWTRCIDNVGILRLDASVDFLAIASQWIVAS